MSVTIGEPLPDFTATATSETLVSRAQLQGKPFVLYFYPKDSTPGCTNESKDFTELYPGFQSLGVEIFGVSRDSLRRHENFKAKHAFPFELISDPEETLCQLFDVIKLKKMYGKEYLGIERSTFLLDDQGRLLKEWRQVKVPGHAAEVLAAAKELLASP